MSATKILLETTIDEYEEHLQCLIRDKERTIKNLEDIKNKIAESGIALADLKNSLTNMNS